MFIYSQSTHFLLDDQKEFISVKPVKGLNLNCRSISWLESERPETTRWWIEVKTKLRHAGWASMILLPHYLDSLVLSFSLTDMDENGYILRLAWEPTVFLVGENKNLILSLPVTVDETLHPQNDCVVNRSPGLTFSHPSYSRVCRVVQITWFSNHK